MRPQSVLSSALAISTASLFSSLQHEMGSADALHANDYLHFIFSLPPRRRIVVVVLLGVAVGAKQL